MNVALESKKLNAAKFAHRPILVMISFWLIFSSLRAKAAPTQSLEDLDVFPESWLTLELARNYPIAFSLPDYAIGQIHPVVGYRYHFSNEKGHWFAGISSQFRMLKKIDPITDEATEAPFFTFAHDISYLTRMYYPIYFLPGLRLLYLLPTRKAMIPFGRDTERSAELGAAIAATFLFKTSTNTVLTARVERWRGTGSMNYHGFELAVGVGVAVDAFRR